MNKATSAYNIFLRNNRKHIENRNYFINIGLLSGRNYKE